MTDLFLTRRALTDLAQIDAYSREKWGRRVADEYLAKFDAAFDLLKATPNLLTPRPDFAGRLMFYRVERHWLVCDRIGEWIFVLTVRHGATDLPSRIAELLPKLAQEAELLSRRIMDEKKH